MMTFKKNVAIGDTGAAVLESFGHHVKVGVTDLRGVFQNIGRAIVVISATNVPNTADIKHFYDSISTLNDPRELAAFSDFVQDFATEQNKAK